MGVQRLGRDTTSVDALAWDGSGFGDSVADIMWSELSPRLKRIAITELEAGNTPANILRNDSRRIRVLSFEKPPMTSYPLENNVKVHTSFSQYNYCYDGTLCTYEDLESGDFLAFSSCDDEDL